MAIGDDFSIDYVNKVVKHVSGTTVYTVNELYSWLMDTFDELLQMDDEVPMSAQTPTEYTMINGWFLDIGELSQAHKYLKGGAIKTDGYENEIQVLTLSATGYTNCVSSDIGKTVQDDGVDCGVLLSYDNTQRKWWIRGSSTIGSGSNMTISGGTGAGTAAADSVSGEDLYANIYTLGTIESTPPPQIYIFQAGEAIAEWSNLSNWDRGHIDVLIQVKEAGTEIDGAQVTVFARQSGDLFDHFEIDLSAGGRNAVPLATQSDINYDTGEYYLLYDGGSGTFQANEIIKEDNGDWEAEVVSVTEYSAGVGLLVIRGFKGTLTDNDSFTGQSSGATGVCNGTLGDTLISWDSGTAFTTLGQVITGQTSGAKRILRGVDATNKKGVCQVDDTVTGSNRVPYYKTFQDDETVTGASDGSVTLDSDSTTLVSGYSDITVAFVNGTVTHSGTTGTFTPGERVTWSGGEAILLEDDGSTLTLGNVTSTSINGETITGDLSGASCTATSDLTVAHTMNKAFTKQPAYPYDVIVECGSIYNAGRPLLQVYQYLKFICQEDSKFKMYTVSGSQIQILDGEEYIQAYSGYTPSKQAPFGTFAGGVFFGAQGVWVEGMASSDIENFQLIDSNGTVRTPPVQATMKVTSLQSGDRVAVYITSAGQIQKDMYTSAATGNTAGNSTFVVQENITLDTPSSGVLRVVDTSDTEFREHRYRYSSWDTSTFTLVTGATGSATTGSSGNTLVDTNADFGGTDNVQVGDVIRNTTDGSYGYIVSIVNSTTLTTRLFHGSDNSWEVGDDYETNTLAVNYDDSDTAYVPLIEAVSTGTYVEQTVLYYTDRPVLVRVRKKGILPYETTGTFTSAGLVVSAIRTTDSIVT